MQFWRGRRPVVVGGRLWPLFEDRRIGIIRYNFFFILSFRILGEKRKMDHVKQYSCGECEYAATKAGELRCHKESKPA